MSSGRGRPGILNLVWMDGKKHIPTAVKSGMDGIRGSETQKRSDAPFGMPLLLLIFFGKNTFRDARLVEILF